MLTVKCLKDIIGGDVPAGSGPLSEIRGISVDSRTVQAGDVFFAIAGATYDGNDFVGDAFSRGAVCVVSSKASPDVDPARRIVVEDPVDALAKFSAKFFGDPSSSMDVVGLTGTNGKTTITYLLEAIYQGAGIPAGVIGTNNYRFGGRVIREGLTTPFPHELQGALAAVKSMGGRHVFMEVSSHGIFQRRISDIRFRTKIFTNLTRDHLDYHGDMENYFRVKKAFFTDVVPPVTEGGKLIVNLNCPYGRRLADELGDDVITYGIGKDANYCAPSPRFSIDGISAVVKTPSGELEIFSRLIGGHNLENILASIACAHQGGMDLHQVGKGIFLLQTVPGRLERVESSRPIHVFVDYAHTPDGLKNVIESLIPHKVGRLIVVFGCGGDRDRGKRPLMGHVAGSLADLALVTSDNPRTEDPLSIIEDILPGCDKGGAVRSSEEEEMEPGTRLCIVEPDRRTAIRRAIEVARDGDIVLIAGKGHEPYQIIGERKIAFDDREVVRNIAG